MKITYEVKDLDYWVSQGLKEAELWEEREERQGLVRLEDGEPKEVVFADGGEPEDMLLRRDLRAFVKLIQKQAETINQQETALRIARESRSG